MKRDKQISFRVSQSEYEKIKELKQGMTIGRYVRESALSKKMKQIPELNQRAYFELSKLNSNLNQLMAKVNQGETELVKDAYDQVLELRKNLIGLKG